jgi:hypothetical protein
MLALGYQLQLIEELFGRNMVYPKNPVMTVQ